MELQVGKHYEFKRITGKVIRMELLAYKTKYEEILFRNHASVGLQGVFTLTDQERASFKEIEPDIKTPG